MNPKETASLAISEKTLPKSKREALQGFTSKQAETVQDKDLLSGLEPSEIDIVALYLKEIGQIPLLTAEEEIELAIQIEKGKGAKLTLRSDGDFTSQEREKLEEIVHAGALSWKRLTQANTRLVVSIAKYYRGRGVPFEDLIQEGNIGLMKAVDKFDYTLGYKFSNYATWWIKQAVTRGVAFQARTIRLPMHVVEALNRTARASRELEKQLGREPRPEEIAKEIGTTVEKVQKLQQVGQHPLSLERPVGDKEGASEFRDFIEDRQALHPPDIASEDIAGEKLRGVVNSLPEREAGILVLLFGLDGGGSRTLGEVGKIYGVSKERIRQIEQEALRRLRHPYRLRKLKGFL